MKYIFEKPKLTCVEIEKALGLGRGDIGELKVQPDGTIEIEAYLSLTLTQESQLVSFIQQLTEVKL